MAWVVEEVHTGSVELWNPDNGLRADVTNSTTTEWHRIWVKSSEIDFTIDINGSYYNVALKLLDRKDWNTNPWVLLLIFADGFSWRTKMQYNWQTKILRVAHALDYDEDIGEALEMGDIELQSYWWHTTTINLGEEVMQMFKMAINSIRSKRFDSYDSTRDVLCFQYAAKRLRSMVPEKYAAVLDQVLLTAGKKLLKLQL